MTTKQDWRATPNPLRHGVYLAISLALVSGAIWMIDKASGSPFESNLGFYGFLCFIVGGLGVATYGVELFRDILKLALDNRGEQ
ncbi:hypothetical protein [Halobacterium sp. CBA1126]|uniref:hypothetical protein n=1 Tax=Halobacterium sp. CBA1126 TaxID=2668074 RepID=UPI0012FC18C4|nr:hypothetical protein [Halobacterium sp. CBA1126]